MTGHGTGPQPASLCDALRDDCFGLTDEEFRAIVQATRCADKQHQRDGGGTRHWLRDNFLPELDAAGFRIVRKADG